MNPNSRKIALITNQNEILNQVNNALSDLFQIDRFPNGLALHYAMQNSDEYCVIISDAELHTANGAPLRETLISLGYSNIPFIVLLNQIDDYQRDIAIREDIADIFAKPINEKNLRTRIRFLATHYRSDIEAVKTVREYKLPLIKRIFDILFSGLALLLLSPLFLLIAILIKMESKGPAFYYSLRVGTGYKVFKFYKFRSMYTGADAKLKDLSHLNQYKTSNTSNPVANNNVKVLCDLCEQEGTGCKYPLYADDKIICESLHKQQLSGKMEAAFIKIKDDPRITKIGKFIRNTSIDELPQLWNVFIGDMSIVGNRPLPLYEAEKITTDKYALRFMAPAGITGLWQVEKRGRGEMSEEERLMLDNDYAKTHSFGNDIRLILKTVPALFQSENV